MTKVLSIINKRLLAINPPYSVTRLPRSVSDFAYWKASELKLFLLSYSVPVLYDLMDEKYFNHHKLLVFAIYLLNQTSISSEMIEKRQNYLTSMFRSLATYMEKNI